MIHHAKKIVAVVVTYHPRLPVLERLLDLIEPQVERIVVVDNGSGERLRSLLHAKVMVNKTVRHHLIELHSNKGIATAQNAGIAWAREQGADYVVLFDQDSEPALDMLANLLTVAERKRMQGIPVASVGPRYLDERQNNPPPFIRIKGMRVVRQPCLCNETVAEVDYLIASGCLMPMSALDRVGGMRDDLFIDYVDIEWGLRAKHYGLQSFGVCAAMMKHDLGDAPIEFMGKKIPVHSPLRHYYHFRNAIWMYRQGWLPLHWKLADGLRLVLKYGLL